jgi:hypothetical protein
MTIDCSRCGNIVPVTDAADDLCLDCYLIEQDLNERRKIMAAAYRAELRRNMIDGK